MIPGASPISTPPSAVTCTVVHPPPVVPPTDPGSGGGGGSGGGLPPGGSPVVPPTGAPVGTGGSPVIDPNPSQPPVLQPFDFAVIRYSWGPANGRDLDSRTIITTPPVAGEVGWHRGFYVPPVDGQQIGGTNPGVPPPSPVFLTWAGDNTTDNDSEGVLVDFAALSAAYPAAPIIVIQMRANWYGETFSIGKDGKITLSFDTYLGGSMTLVPSGNAFTFENVGGQSIDHLQSPAPIQLHTDSNEDPATEGETVAVLTYNVASKRATVEFLTP